MKTRSLFSFLAAALVCVVAACGAGTPPLHVLNIESPADLRAYFNYTGQDIPLVSGHRGGATTGYPENSIATLEHTLRSTPATFEIDLRLTKDSVIVLMHDATLDRTTTGTGRVADHTWEELQPLKLKDPEGNVTSYGIPTLDEVIEWSEGKTVIILDNKDVPREMVAEKISEHEAAAHVMIIVHDAEEAKFYYERNDKLMFEAYVYTIDALREYEEQGIPWSQVMAYIGPENKPENQKLIEMLHARGVMCMISSASTYDKLGPEERKKAYREIIRAGVDIIESDRPIEVAEVIRPLAPESSPKQRFFGKQ